jgi:hypothetical protein
MRWLGAFGDALGEQDLGENSPQMPKGREIVVIPRSICVIEAATCLFRVCSVVSFALRLIFVGRLNQDEQVGRVACVMF